MKKLALAALLALSFNVQADEVCTQLGGFAAAVMENRQIGVPLGESLAVLESEHKGTMKLLRFVVIKAYEQPRWYTEQSVQRAVEDFNNEMTLACLQAQDY